VESAKAPFAIVIIIPMLIRKGTGWGAQEAELGQFRVKQHFVLRLNGNSWVT